MADSFLNLAKDTNQDSKSWAKPKHYNLKKSTSKHIIVKFLKTKDKEKKIKATSKGIKGSQVRNEEIKLSLFTGDIMVFVENPKQSTQIVPRTN